MPEYQSFIITRLLTLPGDVSSILGGKDAAINVVDDRGWYSVQIGTADGSAFHARVCPVERYEIPIGMTPEQIAENELEVLKENPYIEAFVNGVLYRKDA